MLVSAAIPAWNGADYLGEAIESALAQTYQPLEVIVVDDGSTDSTRQVCEAFGDSIRYVYQEKSPGRGGESRNRAMLEARGEWIALLDQDDRWLPEKIERQVAATAQFPDAAAIFTTGRVIDEHGEPVDPQPDLLKPPEGDVFHELFRRNNYWVSSAMVRRSALARSGLPDGVMGCADYALWLRLARHFPFALVDEPLTEYRRHSSGIVGDRLWMTQAHLRVIRSQQSRLHPDCRECEQVYAAALRLARDEAARVTCRRFHRLAREQQFREAWPYLLDTLGLSPRIVCGPRSSLAVFKSLALGLLNVRRPLEDRTAGV